MRVAIGLAALALATLAAGLILACAAAAVEPPAVPGGDATGPRSVATPIPAPPPEPQITLPPVEGAALAWTNSLTLSWLTVPGATGYEIQRWKITGAGGKAPRWKTQGYTVALVWADPKPPRKPAYYRVRAIRADSPRPSYSPWTAGLLHVPPP